MGFSSTCCEGLKVQGGLLPRSWGCGASRYRVSGFGVQDVEDSRGSEFKRSLTISIRRDSYPHPLSTPNPHPQLFALIQGLGFRVELQVTLAEARHLPEPEAVGPQTEVVQEPRLRPRVHAFADSAWMVFRPSVTKMSCGDCQRAHGI